MYLVPERPPVKVERLCEEEPEFCAWIGNLVGAQIRNCTTLMVLRGETYERCNIQ